MAFSNSLHNFSLFNLFAHNIDFFAHCFNFALQSFFIQTQKIRDYIKTFCFKLTIICVTFLYSMSSIFQVDDELRGVPITSFIICFLYSSFCLPE